VSKAIIRSSSLGNDSIKNCATTVLLKQKVPEYSFAGQIDFAVDFKLVAD